MMKLREIFHLTRHFHIISVELPLGIFVMFLWHLYIDNKKIKSVSFCICYQSSISYIYLI